MAIDLTQFHDAFFEESHEAITSMEDALLKLTLGTPDKEVVNTIFRVAHSIKGGAATFGFAEVASFTHTLETLLDELRGMRREVTQEIMDLLLKSVDIMRDMLRAVQAKQPVDMQKVADVQFDLELLVAQKTGAAPPKAASTPAAAPASSAAPASETGWLIGFRPKPELLARGNDPLRLLAELRHLGHVAVTPDLSRIPPLPDLDPEQCHISFEIKLESQAPKAAVQEVFDWAEGDCELSITALTGDGPAPVHSVAAAAGPDSSPKQSGGASGATDAGNIGPAMAHAPVAKTSAPANPDSTSIRVSIEKIDELMNSIGELVITQSMICQLADQFTGVGADRLRAGLVQLDRNVRELQESVMQVRMVPISFVFGRFPRMVRDLAQKLGKQVDLKMTGGDTELDKTMLEKIGDPLVHLVRNGIDHGVEKPDVRTAAGKPATGTVHLHAWHKGSSIIVEVSDDGGGLNRDRLVKKAREKGIVSSDAVLTDREAYELIFAPGFSTADVATDVSGRGVGMDVVRRNIEALGGNVEIDSTPGRGSRFVINLPLTLAIVDGQTVNVGQESYIIPLTAIVESMQIGADMIKTVHGHGEVVQFRGEYLPVLRLGEFLGCRRAESTPINNLLMVVEGEGRRVGLCVDELLGQQQVVVKPLESNYGRIDGVAGATILGDGSVAFILDVSALTRRCAVRAAA